MKYSYKILEMGVTSAKPEKTDEVEKIQEKSEAAYIRLQERITALQYHFEKLFVDNQRNVGDLNEYLKAEIRKLHRIISYGKTAHEALDTLNANQSLIENSLAQLSTRIQILENKISSHLHNFERGSAPVDEDLKLDTKYDVQVAQWEDFQISVRRDLDKLFEITRLSREDVQAF